MALATSITVSARPSIEAANKLVRRIIPNSADSFQFQSLPRDGQQDVFEIHGSTQGITIKGSSTLAMTSGFHWYLKHVAKCHVSWNGDQLKIPSPLPYPGQTIRRASPYKHGFYLNYCTHGYTMAWWTWERWEREIDYMALCGIDMPLAITGAEAIWLNFLKRFGYSHDEAKEVICGSGYFAWWLMGNLEGRGGPLTDEWFDMQVKLQKRILHRMRELGMRPVLPGFVGLVPTTLSRKVPGTKTLPQGQWAGPNERPHLLHPNDPLFPQMARAWYEEMEKLYGKVEVFAGDLFHEGGNTHGLDVTELARTVQSYMLEYNPQSVWTIQGWGNNPKPAFLKGLKKENTLVVDLCNEFWPRWKKTDGFHGFPWTFSTVITYGGNVAYHGRLDAISTHLDEALESRTPPVALGYTGEGIGVNFMVLDFLWDLNWREKSPDLEDWVQAYATRRYGKDSSALKEAWLKLLEGPYAAHPDQRRPGEPVFCMRPALEATKVSPFSASCKIHYDQRLVRDALMLLLTEANSCGKNPTYRFDVVDCCRQFMTNLGQLVYRDMVAAYRSNDKVAFETHAKLFLTMLDDQDRLLGTHEQFLLGKWLHDARNLGPTPKQAAQNERNARLLITTWNHEDSCLRDYGWKEWSGMMKRFYKPRWELFITSLRSRMDGKTVGNLDYFPFESAWAAKDLESDPYPNKPEGDSIVIAGELLKTYGSILDRLSLPVTEADRNVFVGAWEYQASGATWKRILNMDGGLELYRNGKKWSNWKGFTWEFENGVAVLRKANKEVFCRASFRNGLIDFGDGMVGRRVEDETNREAELIQAQ